MGVVTFDISFGSDQVPAAPVGWEDFQQSFLPPDSDTTAGAAPEGASAKAASTTQTNILKGTVNAGLTNSDLDGFDWIIDPHNFLIEISSTIPINQPQWQNSDTPDYVAISNNPVDYNDGTIDVVSAPYQALDDSTTPFSATEVWNGAISIRPMDINNVQSILTFTIKKRSGVDFSDYVNEIAVEPQLSDVPAAQWKQNPSTPDPNEDPFLRSALTGFVFAPIPRTPQVVNPVPLHFLLFQAGNFVYFDFLAAAVNTDYTLTSVEDDTLETLNIVVSETVGGTALATLDNSDYILEGINDNWVNTQRNTLLDALTDAGFSTFTSAEVDVSAFASETILTDWPQVMQLGDRLETA